MKSLLHLAYHVTDLDAARSFYGSVLGCRERRSTETWVGFDFFGHQISLHLGRPFEVTRTGRVGDHMVMMPHLGVVLPLDAWLELAARLESAGIAFDIPPVVRFKDEPGEQRTMFFFTIRVEIQSKSKALRISTACSQTRSSATPPDD